jgi:multiple sugar transport system ATP-binding protein
VNRFVAGFIGSPAMNFLSGRVRLHGDTVSLAMDGLELDLSGRAATVARSRGDGSALVLGMRPEHFDAANTQTAGVVRVPATVDVVEFLGNDELIHANVAGNDIVAMVPASRGVAVGDAVNLVIADSVVHIIDPETDAVISGGEAVRAATQATTTRPPQ